MTTIILLLMINRQTTVVKTIHHPPGVVPVTCRRRLWRRTWWHSNDVVRQVLTSFHRKKRVLKAKNSHGRHTHPPPPTQTIRGTNPGSALLGSTSAVVDDVTPKRTRSSQRKSLSGGGLYPDCTIFTYAHVS